jgi:Cd2+/Zn2+-exporting ATPase/Cu+-exporting ATPase
MDTHGKGCGHHSCACCCSAHLETDAPRAPKLVDLLRIALVAIAIILVWIQVWEPIKSFSLIGAVATVVCGYPIFRKALTHLSARRMTMELSMTIALVAALAIAEVFTALVIVFFVLIAEEIEKMTLARGRRSIKQLLNLLPSTAARVNAGTIEEVQVSSLKAGDMVVVKPGSAIPVDGEVVAGVSFVNEASITGEAMPAEKTAGSAVYAGTLNQSGVLEVKTKRVGPDTAYGKIVTAVEEAEKSRAVVERLADRLAGYLVYFALVCAAATFIVTGDLRATISVILVTGACGIAAGTPLAILGGIGRAAKNGMIFKGGLYLEQLATVDTVVFDKTGTLTNGAPEVISVIPVVGETPEAVLSAAASAELLSEHPLGKAIVKRARSLSLPVVAPTDFNYTPGRGIVCLTDGVEIVVGNRKFLSERGLTSTDREVDFVSEVLVARGGALLGRIQISDTLRPEAAKAVAALKSMGIKTVLLTGDSAGAARVVAHRLGIGQVESGLHPEDKKERVRQFAAQGRKVAMVGDGYNDAPALMEALVGVAVGSGTDVARESADAVLIGNDLLKFVESIKIARQCRRIILTNFVGTLLIDGLGVVLAALGLLNPLFAVIIHVTSESIFILNSARLLPAFSTKKKHEHNKGAAHAKPCKC